MFILRHNTKGYKPYFFESYMQALAYAGDHDFPSEEWDIVPDTEEERQKMWEIHRADQASSPDCRPI